MLPKYTGNLDTFSIKKQPSFTYRLNLDREKIQGNINQIEAVKQAIYKIINTERYENIIYSWNYGIEIQDLFGKPIPYVCNELPHRITEALLQDDRILSVNNFQFSKKKGVITVTFSVETIYGDTSAEWEMRL